MHPTANNWQPGIDERLRPMFLCYISFLLIASRSGLNESSNSALGHFIRGALRTSLTLQ